MERYFMSSLAKGLNALKLIAEAAHPITLSELAEALGTTKTTATRICYTLKELELIRRNRDKRYQITPNVLAFGYAAICAQGWREVARYYLEGLFDKIQETVNMCVLEGTEILHILRIKKNDFLSFDVLIGTKLPAHCTAAGKVLMAMGPPEKTRPALENMPLRPLTSHTITNMDAYLNELEEIRRKGYGIAFDELSIGSCAVAAPVMDQNGHAIAAVNIVVSTSQYSRQDLDDNLAPSVTEVAKQISDALIRMDSPGLDRSAP